MTKDGRGRAEHQGVGAPRPHRPPTLNTAHVEFLGALAQLIADEVVTHVMGQSGTRPPRNDVEEPSTITQEPAEEPSTSDGRP